MQLLSTYLCAATPLHRLPVCSISSTQCRTLVLGPASCSVRRDRTRLHAQFQEGVDSETVNVTDLRNADPELVEPASLPYMAGLSEEEMREALLFEEGNNNPNCD